jgi:arsenate reductase-like glutaredoxin family protein
VQRIFGQQSLVGFMGLHVDIDQIYEDNKRKEGNRKQGFLVNDGDKLTKEQKIELKEKMKEKYGLHQKYVQEVLKLPPKSKVKIYDIDKIVNSRIKMSTAEKIEHLMDLKDTLIKRLDIIKSGKKLIGFQVEKYQDWLRRFNEEQKLQNAKPEEPVQDD